MLQLPGIMLAGAPIACACIGLLVMPLPHHRVVVQACTQYHAMLRDVYGQELMLKPHVMPVSVLHTTDPAGDTPQPSLLKHM